MASICVDLNVLMLLSEVLGYLNQCLYINHTYGNYCPFQL